MELSESGPTQEGALPLQNGARHSCRFGGEVLKSFALLPLSGFRMVKRRKRRAPSATL
jgi:hypothetical protein